MFHKIEFIYYENLHRIQLSEFWVKEMIQKGTEVEIWSSGFAIC